MSRTLTLETLKSKNACREQVELFQKLFGDSVEITPELCVKHAKDFYFNWAVRNLLSNAALDKYHAERNAAYDKYHAERIVLWSKHLDEIKSSHGKYDAEIKSKQDRYDTEKDVRWDKYCAEKASIFANAYINDVEQ